MAREACSKQLHVQKKGCMVGASLGAFQVQKECWWDWSTEVEG